MLALALENKMKVNQIVSEHKKGVRAMKYAKKTKSTVPVYGPDAGDAKLKPVKPQGPSSSKVNEEMAGQMVGKVQQVKPDGSVEIQKPSGDTTTVQSTALQPGDNNKLTMQVPKIQPGMQVDADTAIEENPSGPVAHVNTKMNPPMVMDSATGSPLGVTKTGEEITPELIARSSPDWQERTIQSNGKTYTALYSGTRGYRVGQRTYQAITGGAVPMRESKELDAIKKLSGL